MKLEKKDNFANPSYSKLSEVKLITIGLASPERIKQWASKTLPNGKILGEVINANTLHHKTFKPQKGGLFCERIFGPLKDFECACGKPLKYKKNQFTSRESNFLDINSENSIKSGASSASPKIILGEVVTKTRNFCNICEVEYTWSVMRRYQLGYIKLISPVTHVWYLKGNPSYLSILLDIKKRHLEYITYCSETLTLENGLKGGAVSSKSSDIVSSWNKLKEQIRPKKVIQENNVNVEDKKSNFPRLKNLRSNKFGGIAENKLKKREQISLNGDKYWLKKSRNMQHNEDQNYLAKPENIDFLNGSEIQLKSLKKLVSINTKQSVKTYSNKDNVVFNSWEKTGDDSKGNPLDLKKTIRLCLKSYANKINLKNLKILSILISQQRLNSKKQLNSNNNELAPKKILKNVSIPFYILLNLNILSQKSITKSVMDTTWEKLSEKALKKALIRVYKIFNKMDSIAFKQNWLDSLNNIKNLDPVSAVQTLSTNNIVAPHRFMSTRNYADALTSASFFRDVELDSDMLLDTKSSFLPPNAMSWAGSVSGESIKQFFYNSIFEIPNSNVQVQNQFISKNLANNIKLESRNSLLVKSHSFLEFYTLSNFPTSLVNFIISTFLIKSVLSVKPIENSSPYKTEPSVDQATPESKSTFDLYKSITKNLSEIFFQILFKKGSAKYNIAARYKIKQQNATKGQNPQEQISPQAQDFFKVAQPTKNGIIAFKKQLSLYYLVSNFKSDNVFKLKDNVVQRTKNQDLAQSKGSAGKNNLLGLFIQKSNWTVKLIQIIETNLVKKNVLQLDRKLESNNSILASPNNNKTSLLFGDPSVSSLKIESEHKKLYNNMYCLSHRERWETENDWASLYYFNTAPSENGEIIIPNYRSRYQNNPLVHSTYYSEGSMQKQEKDYLAKPESQDSFSQMFTNNQTSFTPTPFITANEMGQKSAFFSGPGIVQQLLKEFNFQSLKNIDKQNRILLYQLNKQIFKLKKTARFSRSAKKELKESYKKRDLLIRRTKLVRKLFIKSPEAAEDTILTVLPVLPPDLRPIVKMGGQIAASDLNRLYQRVIYRNDRLKKFLKDPATSHSYEMKYAQRLLQEAVDNLIQNGKSGVVSEKDSRGRALKSLSDILKGKQGRFRQYLLGKRVDYSGRSVIVVGPKLKLHECGLPKEMALELYLPFLLKRILNENLARTVVGAKTLIKTNPSLVWELLREIMQTCPVLLNRAPTLHRLGIQAFQPKLIDGRAILLHPLVCSAFNADFDGDQMAVHVPITVEARAEAWKLMLSRNNILSPATGDPLAIPSQDMVLGCYYLTTSLLNRNVSLSKNNFGHKKGSGFYFSTIEDALKDYALKEIELHSNIWLKWDGFIENGTDQEEPIEIRIDSYGNWKEIYNKSQKSYNSKNKRFVQYILTTPGKILFNRVIKKATSLT